jgi:hypothetical protein
MKHLRTSEQKEEEQLWISELKEENLRISQQKNEKVQDN